MTHKTLKTLDQNPHLTQSPILGPVRLTAAAWAALEKENQVEQVSFTPTNAPLYLVTLTYPPRELVGCHIEHHLGICLDSEPYRQNNIAWYFHGKLVPCPHPGCGAALLWYEAGYVPGYRICLHGHHAQLCPNGRSAYTR